MSSYNWLLFILVIAPLGAMTQAPKPTPQQLAWQDDEYYWFLHFGPNTFTGKEWGDGKEKTEIFNPALLDTDQWCRIAKAAGAKGMIDRDGKFTYSKVVMINPEEQSKLKVYPNPATQSIWVKHPLTEKGMVMITSTDGRVLRTYTLSRNTTTSQINLGQLPAGNYMVVYEDRGMKETIQITKQ